MDDDLPQRRDDPLSALVSEDIDRLSVEDLSARIETLKNEITRCEGRLAFAQGHRASADALFKK